MRSRAIRNISAFVLGLTALLGLSLNTSHAQSVWDKIKEAARQAQQQQKQQQQQQRPGQPQQQQPGQRQRPGQQQATGQGQAADSGPIVPPAGTKIEEKVLAPVEQVASYVVSSAGIHVATLSHSDSRQVVIYDGVAGPKFDQIFPQGTNFGVVFSPDGNRYAYCGQSGNQYVVMVDGKELARSSDSVGGAFSTYSCMLGFTSNSKHVYYTTTGGADSNNSTTRFVFDGKATPPGAPNDMRQYIFSPDGDHFTYVWNDPTPNSQRSFLLVDGKPVLDAATGGANVFTNDTWQMGANGTLSILVQDDTSLKRVTITP